MAKKSGGFNIKELLQGQPNSGAGPAMPTATAPKKKGKKSKGSANQDVIGQPTPMTPPGGMGMGM
jgi:hypothetical protein